MCWPWLGYDVPIPYTGVLLCEDIQRSEEDTLLPLVATPAAML
jgi:hypothetical protein